MLKLATKPTYKRVVPIEVPLDMGKTEKQSFIMEFKRLSVSDTKTLIDDAANNALVDEEMILRYCVGWEGVLDADGEEMPYTKANLDLLLDVPHIRKGIMGAFIEDVFGKEATRKN